MYRIITIASITILMLVATDAVQAEVITFDATIKSVDAKSCSITVERKGKTREFDVSRKAKITIDGEKTDLIDLKEGQEVSLSYHDDLEIVLSIEAGAVSEEFVSLFDGKTLNGWKTYDSEETYGWEVRNGSLVTRAVKNVPFLITEDSYDDFEFKCDFWLNEKANTGIYFRGRYELQILDDDNIPNVPPKNVCGSIVGQHAPTKSMYRGARKWNELQVRLEGKTVTVMLNGETIINRKRIKEVTAQAIGSYDQKPGPIALQHRGSLVRYRNLSIRPLSE